MAEHDQPSRDRRSLRERAEERLKIRSGDLERMSTKDVEALVHELQVHEIELELQNEDLREAQFELTKSRDRLSDLYEFAPVGYLTLDDRGKILAGNLTACTMLGVERTHLVGRYLSRFIERDSQDTFYLHRQAVLRSDVKQACELWMATSDGVAIGVQLESVPVEDADGRRSGCRTTLSDVTARKRAEEELRRLNETLEQQVQERTAELAARNERYRTVVETAGAVIMVLDPNFNILEWNGAAEQVFGYTREEVLGRSYPELMLPNDVRETVEHTLVTVLSDGSVQAYEHPMRTRGGNTRTLLWNATRLLDAGGRTTGLAKIGQDITERKALYRELLTVAETEQQRIGQELHDTTGQELTGLSLTAQALYQRLQEKTLPEAEAAQRIVEALDRALGQVRAHARGLVPVEVDAEGLKAALQELADWIDKYYTGACTFQCPRPVLVENNSTATHLYRIAQEAVTNALRHADAGKIEISLADTEQVVTLTVRDNGKGIEQAVEAEGMGLRIMRYRAEVIGARLSVEGDEGAGTVVTCMLGGAKREDGNQRSPQ